MEQSTTYHELLNDVSRQLALSQLSQLPSRSSSRRSAQTSSTTNTRTTRIEKATSKHNSPKVLESRRTTASAHCAFFAKDHLAPTPALSGMPRQARVLSGRARSERPLSWHSTSTPSYDMARTTTCAQTGAFYPLSCPLNRQYADPPAAYMAQSYKPPSRCPSAQVAAAQHPASYASLLRNATASNPNSACYPAPASNNLYVNERNWYFTPAREPFRGLCLPASRLMASLPSYQNSFYSEPDCCPRPTTALQESYVPSQAPLFGAAAQHVPMTVNEVCVDALTERDSQPKDQELIGMGLYDTVVETAPKHNEFGAIQTQLCSSLPIPSSGKGLKLEETFQPPPELVDFDDGEAGTSEESPDDESRRFSYFDADPSTPFQALQTYPDDASGQMLFTDEEVSLWNAWFPEQSKSAEMASENHSWLDGSVYASYN